MEQEKILASTSITDLPEIAQTIIEFAGNEKIWILNGKMGAGKTTLSKHICHELGVTDTVSSPTFSLVNEYITQSEETVYHFDFYRLDTPEEVLGIGISEYFDSGNICLIEWASKIEPYLPDEYLLITIIADEDGTRSITLSHES